MWIEAAEETLLYLSVLTRGEIWKGLAALPQGKRRSRLVATSTPHKLLSRVPHFPDLTPFYVSDTLELIILLCNICAVLYTKLVSQENFDNPFGGMPIPE